MPDQQFEFSEEHNKDLQALARFMKYTGLLFIFFGILIGIFCSLTIIKYPLHGIAYLLQTLLAVAVGVWTNSASYYFNQIVKTTGSDIDHLMSAVQSLRKMYTLQFMWLIIITSLIFLTLILGIVFSFHTSRL